MAAIFEAKLKNAIDSHAGASKVTRFQTLFPTP